MPSASTARLITRLGLLAAALSLAGCGALMKTPYSQPEVVTPGQWRAPTADTPTAGVSGGAVSNGAQPDVAQPDAAADPWWHQFADPGLNALIDEVLRSNNNLAAAAIRVRRAQILAGLAQSDLYPSVGASGGSTFERSLDDSSNRSQRHSVSASVSYEADLWGRLASQRDAARWEALATEEDLRSAELALVGTTMSLYWQGGFLNQRITAAGLSIDYAQRTLDLVRAQYAAGAVSGLEVAEAESNLANEQSAMSQLRQQRVENLNALALLLNGPPSADVPVPANLPDTPLPEVRAGLPAELLGRRPDLRAAELRLRETLAGNDALRASYYPTLSLTGSLGSASTALASVLQNPIAALGFGITLPFLQWNQMQLDIAASKTGFEEAVVDFRQTLYTAMGDVENALSARVELARQATLLQQSLASAERAEALYEVRYRAGAVPLRTWLNAQEQRRNTEIAVTENRLARYNNQVLLYQALGGDARI